MDLCGRVAYLSLRVEPFLVACVCNLCHLLHVDWCATESLSTDLICLDIFGRALKAGGGAVRAPRAGGGAVRAPKACGGAAHVVRHLLWDRPSSG